MIMAKKKVFLVINSLNGGGAEHVAARLSHVWQKKYDLTVISLAGPSSDDYMFGGNIVYLSDCGRSVYALRNKLDKICKEKKPEVIIAFLQKASLVSLLLHYKCKRIVSIRNYIEKKYSGVKLVVWKYLIKKLYPRADYVVSVSKEINSRMINEYGLDENKCKCIYNPYDIENILKMTKSENPFKKDMVGFYTLVNMGHISKQKGQIHLIRIMSELLKIIPNIKLVIIGNNEGEYAMELKKYVCSNKLNDNVIFTGVQKNPYAIISDGDLFVFPSLFEGFPNALVEAMVCKKPVISTDCKTGPKEILAPGSVKAKKFIQNEFGILIPCIDDLADNNQGITRKEEELIKSIVFLYNNPSEYKRYSEKAYERSMDFRMMIIAKEWEGLING